MKLLSVAAAVGGLLRIETTTLANFESSHTTLHQTVRPVTQSDFNTNAFPGGGLFCCDILRVLVSQQLNAQYQIFLMLFYRRSPFFFNSLISTDIFTH